MAAITNTLETAVATSQDAITRRIADNAPRPVVGGKLFTIEYIWKRVEVPRLHRSEWNLVIWDRRAAHVVIDVFRGNPVHDPRYQLSDNGNDPVSLHKYSC